MKSCLKLLLLFSITTFSQSYYTAESIEVSVKDLEIKSYEKDSTAKALVIYDYGNSRIYLNDRYYFKLETKVKRKLIIFDKNKVDKATIEIYLYNDDSGKRKETIKDIKATTYNLVNKKIVKIDLPQSGIFKEVLNKNYTVVKFTLPNIQDGSVITYSYTKESPFKAKFHGWEFQDDIPKLYSEYNASIPGNYEYNIRLVGSSKLETNVRVINSGCVRVPHGGGTADCVNYKYVMKNIPAFKEEDFMTTKDNYLARIDYELKLYKSFNGSIENYTRSWKTADKELKIDESIGRQLNKSSQVKNLIDASIENENDPLKKAQAIFHYVQSTYAWNEKHELFKDVSVKNLIKNKSGKASEINILLHNLLAANDINVNPVLLSTRKNGLPTKLYPVLYDFNYLIVQAYINGKKYLLDATNDYLSFGEIPFKCLNSYGRLLNFKKGSRWIDLEARKSSAIQHQISLKLNNSELKGDIKSRYLGYHALPKKKTYYTNTSSYLDDFENKYIDISVIEHELTSKGKADDKFQEAFEIEFNDLNITGDKIYLDPFIFKFFTKNPFQLQERSYPIDFGFKDSFLYSFELDLNDQYEVVETPKATNVTLPNNTGEFIFATEIEGNKLTVFFKIIFKESIYHEQYYGYLKEFMSRVVDVQKNSLIVLKRK